MTATPRFPIRVLHVISGGMFGGGQRLVLDLIETLSQLGDVLPSLCLLQRDHPNFAKIDHDVIPYTGNYRNPWVALPAARKLSGVIQKSGAQIVHTHGYDAELIGALACGATKVIHVSHLHDTPAWVRSTKFKHRLRRFCTKAITSWAHSFWIACADAVKNLAIAQFGYPPARIFAVRNCIRTEPFAVLPAKDKDFNEQNSCTIGAVGRLAKTKGLHVLIHAVHQLVKEGFNIKLNIAGDGPERKYLQRLAEDGPAKDRVTFLGWIQPIAEFYSQIDVFCLSSSSSEGLPLVILEAMASGLPVIATDVMGTREVVLNGRTGLLVPPESLEALRDAIARIYHDRTWRVFLATEGRQFVLNNHDMVHMANQVYEIYRLLTA